MNKVIEIKNLTRHYKIKDGIKKAIDGISFDVFEGEVFGLLGPNGAGKTTTIKVLTTLLSPTSGTVKIFDYDVLTEHTKIRNYINFVYGGEKGVYGRLTALEYMYYFCTLYKIPRKEQFETINRLLILVGLRDSMSQKINTFSKGMIQRLHISRCLINEPKLIFLDEPTIGLDPIGARILRELIKDLSSKGITIILTTHYMQEADELCDRIAFIKNGKIKLIGNPTEIKDLSNNLQIYEATMLILNPSIIESETEISVKNIEEIKKPFYLVQFEHKQNNINPQGLSAMLEQYGEVLNVKRKEISLEDAYIYHMEERG